MKASEMGHLFRDTDPGSSGSPNPADDPESVPLWRPSWRRRVSILPEATTLEKFTHLRLSRGFTEGIIQQNFTCHRLLGCFRFDPDEELICRCSGIRCWIQFVCLLHSHSIYTIIRESSIMEKAAPFLSDLCRNQHKRDKDVINQSYSWGSLWKKILVWIRYNLILNWCPLIRRCALSFFIE